jgi:nucleoside-diphosphate-sugar epimerase
VSERVLVTGASGFVGAALVPALLKEGRRVRALARDRRAQSLPGAEVAALPDLRGTVDWGPLLEGVGAVVHLAGVAHVGPRVDPAVYDRVNHVATAELAAGCAKAGVRRLVFVSSVRAQSGAAATHVLKETDAPRPSEPYGRSKLMAEQAVRSSAVPSTILRPAMVYGPGVKGNLARLMRLAASPWPLPFASFASKRSLVSLDNLIAAILHVLEAESAAGETYLVADPGPVTLAEILTALRRGAGRSPNLFPVPPALFETALKLAGRADVWERLGGALIVDASKLIAAGWRPDPDTKAGLARMVEASLRAA